MTRRTYLSRQVFKCHWCFRIIVTKNIMFPMTIGTNRSFFISPSNKNPMNTFFILFSYLIMTFCTSIRNIKLIYRGILLIARNNSVRGMAINTCCSFRITIHNFRRMNTKFICGNKFSRRCGFRHYFFII